MTVDTNLRSKPLAAADAHQLVVDIEHLGVEASHIKVYANPPAGSDAVGRADKTALWRPTKRAALGTVYGAAVASTLALIVAVGWDLVAAPVVVAAGIAGAVLGGLLGLYSRLAMSPTAYDVDAGGVAVVEASLDDEDETTARRVRELVHQAEIRSGTS